MEIPALAAWLPAVILPLSTALQLRKFRHTENVRSASATAWFLFALANVGAYIFAEKYYSVAAILAFLLTAALDLVIVAMIFIKSK